MNSLEVAAWSTAFGMLLGSMAALGIARTYRPDTWHHGLTVLDRPGRFAIFMWRDGTKGDEEFVPVPPFTICIP